MSHADRKASDALDAAEQIFMETVAADKGCTSLSRGVGVPADRFEVKLPSGAVAQVLRRGTGKHLVLAEQMAGSGALPGSMRWNMGLIAAKCLIDSQPVTLEEVEEMEDVDVLQLVGAVLGKGVGVSAPATSPSSGSTEPSLTAS